MSRSRRTRLYRFMLCDRSTSKDFDLSYKLPRELSPRQTMANSESRQITIHPNDRSIKVGTPLVAILDTGIDCSILSKRALQTNSMGLADCNVRQLYDSSGERYDCIKELPATWRIAGHYSSVSERFVIASGDFPDGIDVLLASSTRNQNVLRTDPRTQGDYMLPVYGDPDRKSKSQCPSRSRRHR